MSVEELSFLDGDPAVVGETDQRGQAEAGEAAAGDGGPTDGENVTGILGVA